MSEGKRGDQTNVVLSASVGCIDPLEYRDMIRNLEKNGIDAYHFDLSDGHFAPTIVLSIPTIGAFRRYTEKRLDVHMYCTHPSTFLHELKKNGTTTCIVCVESGENIEEVVHKIHKAGMRAGIGILPSTKIPGNMSNLIALVEMVIVNMVGPAYSGQPFDPRGLRNLAAVRQLIVDSGREIELAVDGNVSIDRLKMFLLNGVRHLVCGTAGLFIPDTDTGENILSLRREISAFFEENEKE